MRFSLTIMVILFFSFCTIGQIYYENDNTLDIYDLTDNTSNNIREQFNDLKPINLSNVSIEERGASRISNLITHSINYGLLCMIEFFGFGMEYGFNHPTVNYTLLVKVLIWLCIISISVQLFIPICVLVYLSYLGIKKIVNINKIRRK